MDPNQGVTLKTDQVVKVLRFCNSERHQFVILTEAALILGLLLALTITTMPAFSQPSDKLPPEITGKDWLLAFVDVETTGLIPGHHEMIDIGIIIADLAGNPIDERFLRIMPAHPERIEAGAASVNGFSEALWQDRGFISEQAAVAELLEFTQQTANGRGLLMVGYNAWFDIAFIDQLFRSQERSWREMFHYFVLDLPSMAWGKNFRDLTGARLAQQLGIVPETSDPYLHTGLTGAQQNLKLYQALLTPQKPKQ